MDIQITYVYIYIYVYLSNYIYIYTHSRYSVPIVGEDQGHRLLFLALKKNVRSSTDDKPMFGDSQFHVSICRSQVFSFYSMSPILDSVPVVLHYLVGSIFPTAKIKSDLSKVIPEIERYSFSII